MNTLRLALVLNALFSLISGIVFVIFYKPIGTHLGIAPFLLVLFTGISLIGFSLFVGYTALKKMNSPGFVWSIIALDILWIVGTVITMLADIFPYTNLGDGVMAGLSVVVFGFALAQYIGLQKLSSSI